MVEMKPEIYTTNLSEIAWCDKFICKACGIHLEGWARVEMSEEFGEDHFEYEFNFCPNCGAKIKEVNKNAENT